MAGWSVGKGFGRKCLLIAAEGNQQFFGADFDTSIIPIVHNDLLGLGWCPAPRPCAKLLRPSLNMQAQRPRILHDLMRRGRGANLPHSLWGYSPRPQRRTASPAGLQPDFYSCITA